MLPIALLALATDFIVAPQGGDFTSIQAGLDAAQPGDRVLVRERAGGWRERVVFPRSGSAALGPIELMAFPGESPVLDTAGIAGQWMVTIQNKSHVRVAGLELQGNVGIGDGSGVRVAGSGTNIVIEDCTFHDLTGDDSMAITVYGTSTSAPIEDIVIRGNTIYDCEPSESEALTLNGNVRGFLVEGNLVRDVNNIGIDFIGGEPSINPLLGARDGVCRNNVVLRANSSYGAGFGAGIYVDGGRDILIERNLVVGSDLGIEVGAEHAGWDAFGIVVRNNVMAGNEKAGLVFGGYDASVGRVRDCVFTHNLIWQNGTVDNAVADLWVQLAESCSVTGNVVVASPAGANFGNLALASDAAISPGVIDGNLWYGATGAPGFRWNNTVYGTFAAFQSATGYSAGGLFGDPNLAGPRGVDGILGTADDDYGLAPNSIAIDAGDARAYLNARGGLNLDGEILLDYVGADRLVDVPSIPDRLASTLGTAPDLGAVEFSPAPADPAIRRLCLPSPTGAGDRARLAIQGDLSIGANTLTLRGENLPPGSFGLFFFAPLRASIPLGSGVICLQGSLYRLPPIQSSAAGIALFPINLNQNPPGTGFAPGDTWVFQHWFRDSAGPSGFNFSDAVEVTFAP